MRYDIGADDIAGIVELCRPKGDLGADPLGPIRNRKIPELVLTWPELVHNPCTDEFELHDVPPYPSFDCPEVPYVDLTGIPPEKLTPEKISTSLGRLTAEDAEPSSMLVAGWRLNQLAVFHKKQGRDELSDMLTAAVDELFTESLKRVRDSRSRGRS